MQDVLIDNKYRILRELGQGGSGSVYVAWHEQLQKEVALKILSDPNADPNEIRRFQQEAHALSSCNHPSIVHIHAFGMTPDGRLYYVMDYLQGVSLAKEVKTTGPLRPARFARVFDDILAALDHAHKAGLIHRDLKPSNIMLTTDGGVERAVLIDFGITRSLRRDVRLTATEAVIGTPFYMAPEQCSGGEVDQRSDLYSLGCTMIEASTGNPPFQGETLEVLLAQMHEAPKAVPPELASLLAKLLAKAPNERFANAEEARNKLNELELTRLDKFSPLVPLNSAIVSAKTPKLAAPASRTFKPGVGLLSATAIIIVAASIAGWTQFKRAEVKDVQNEVANAIPHPILTRERVQSMTLEELNSARPEIKVLKERDVQSAAYSALAAKEFERNETVQGLKDAKEAVGSMQAKEQHDFEIQTEVSLFTDLCSNAANYKLPLDLWKAEALKGRQLASKPKFRGNLIQIDNSMLRAGALGDSLSKQEVQNLTEEALSNISHTPSPMPFEVERPLTDATKWCFAHNAIPEGVRYLRKLVQSVISKPKVTGGANDAEYILITDWLSKVYKYFSKDEINRLIAKLDNPAPSDPNYSRVNHYCWCAQLAFEIGQTKRAKEYFKKAFDVGAETNDFVLRASVLHQSQLIPMSEKELLKCNLDALNFAKQARPLELGALATCYDHVSNSFMATGEPEKARDARQHSIDASNDWAAAATVPSEKQQRKTFSAGLAISGAWQMHQAHFSADEARFVAEAESLLAALDTPDATSDTKFAVRQRREWLARERRGVEPNPAK